MVDPEIKWVQVVPRAVDPDQQRVQLALQLQLQHLSRAVAEAAPKRSKNSAGCTIEKNDDFHDAYSVFVPQHLTFETLADFYIDYNDNCHPLPIMKYEHELV